MVMLTVTQSNGVPRPVYDEATIAIRLKDCSNTWTQGVQT
jgi:hypothetical protein